jgi:hypothetical protein
MGFTKITSILLYSFVRRGRIDFLCSENFNSREAKRTSRQLSLQSPALHRALDILESYHFYLSNPVLM